VTLNEQVTVIEFFGMPGAGKTYMYGRLVDYLSNRGWKLGVETGQARFGRAGRALGKVLLAIKELLRCGGAAPTAWRIIRQHGLVSMGRGLRVTINLLQVRGSLRRQSQTARVLCRDQGIAQALWSACWIGSGIGQGKQLGWDDLRGDLPYHFVILCVDVDPELAALRTKQRRKTANPLDGPAQNKKCFIRALDLTGQVRSTIADAAIADSRIRLLTVRTTGPALADDVLSELGHRVECVLLEHATAR